MAYIYCRVSSKKQTRAESVSLDAQHDAIVASAKGIAKGSAKKVIKEVGSGFSGRQEQLKSLIRTMKPESTLYVYSLDRFSRNMQNSLKMLDELTAKKCKLVSITQPLNYEEPGGRMHFMTIISAAECQSRTTSSKVKMANSFKRSQGSHIGVAPFGYRLEKKTATHLGKMIKVNKIVEDEEQQRVIEFIVALRKGELRVNVMNNMLKKIANKQNQSKWEPMKFFEGKKEIERLRGMAALSFSNIASILNEYGVQRFSSNKEQKENEQKWRSSAVSKVFAKAIQKSAASIAENWEDLMAKLSLEEESKKSKDESKKKKSNSSPKTTTSSRKTTTSSRQQSEPQQKETQQKEPPKPSRKSTRSKRSFTSNEPKMQNFLTSHQQNADKDVNEEENEEENENQVIDVSDSEDDIPLILNQKIPSKTLTTSFDAKDFKEFSDSSKASLLIQTEEDSDDNKQSSASLNLNSTDSNSTDSNSNSKSKPKKDEKDDDLPMFL